MAQAQRGAGLPGRLTFGWLGSVAAGSPGPTVRPPPGTTGAGGPAEARTSRVTVTPADPHREPTVVDQPLRRLDHGPSLTVAQVIRGLQKQHTHRPSEPRREHPPQPECTHLGRMPPSVWPRTDQRAGRQVSKTVTIVDITGGMRYRKCPNSGRRGTARRGGTLCSRKPRREQLPRHRLHPVQAGSDHRVPTPPSRNPLNQDRWHVGRRNRHRKVHIAWTEILDPDDPIGRKLRKSRGQRFTLLERAGIIHPDETPNTATIAHTPMLHHGRTPVDDR